MRFHGKQQVAERAEQVWADRLALHRRRIQLGLLLVDGHGEVVRPEAHEPLEERVLRA